ncbi:MAG: serine/threonine-protein kinase, partial [Steroidobacteraceae bacterium]
MSDAPITQLGRYQVRRELGRGAMGVVYEAQDPMLDRTVAIKTILLPGDAAERKIYEARFFQEARAAGRLNHPAIITIYDVGREGDLAYMAMELLPGIDLRRRMNETRLSMREVLTLAAEVADGLGFAHEHGVEHRDIKPANIMLSRSGGVKLMDFGIARDENFDDLTEAGTGIGTPAYMSPEQVLGDKLDARSDLFSLGVVLYQMVTGKKPFVEDEHGSALHKIRLDKHLAARKLNPEIPRELERIIDRCLEKQPRERWRSAQHMVMALERFLARHVEMNHHARIVLFLRAQNVITDLEAEEYVN